MSLRNNQLKFTTLEKLLIILEKIQEIVLKVMQNVWHFCTDLHRHHGVGHSLFMDACANPRTIGLALINYR